MLSPKLLIAQGLELREKLLLLLRNLDDAQLHALRKTGNPLGGLKYELFQWLNETKVAMEKFSVPHSLLGVEAIITNPTDLREDLPHVVARVEGAFEVLISNLRALPAWEDGGIATVVPNTAFIMMWMDRHRPELEDVQLTLKEVFNIFSIEAARADDFATPGVITRMVLDKIRDSEFLVADLTGERPNVYYEIGYAHAIGKEPMLFRKEGTRLHFDIAVHDAPQYRNMKELKELLTVRVKNQLDKRRPRES